MNDRVINGIACGFSPGNGFTNHQNRASDSQNFKAVPRKKSIRILALFTRLEPVGCVPNSAVLSGGMRLAGSAKFDCPTLSELVRLAFFP